jgi:alpha-mannosidase
MKYVENNHGKNLQVIQKAWPDWWTDGFGSAARETAAAREAQSEMNITTGLFSMAAILGFRRSGRMPDRANPEII